MAIKRTGECNQCGKCCEPPTLERIEAYHMVGYECDTQFEDGCPHFVGNKCNDYEGRNQMCRDFPIHPVDIETIPECGYLFKEG